MTQLNWQTGYKGTTVIMLQNWEKKEFGGNSFFLSVVFVVGYM